MNKIRAHIRMSLVALLVLSPYILRAQTIRYISHREGLVNGAVLDVLPDREGIVWIGTCAGLFTAEGNTVTPPMFVNGLDLDGYLIEDLVQADGYIWARTSHGLKYWDKSAAELKSVDLFNGVYSIKSTAGERLLVKDKNGLFFYYDRHTGKFVQISVAGQNVSSPVSFGIAGRYLWLAGEEGVYRYAFSGSVPGTKTEGPGQCVCNDRIISAFDDPEGLYFVDSEGLLSHLDIQTGHASPIADISSFIEERGTVTGVLEMGGATYVSFASDGVIEISKDEDGSWKFSDIGLRAGVFRLRKEYDSDYLYIATDGRGVACYAMSRYRFEEFRSTDFSKSISQPVRAIYKDRNGRLWVGTKGSGLLEIGASLHTAKSSGLLSDEVYALAESRREGFWIGTDGGLQFYDYSSGRIVTPDGGGQLPHIHSILEVNDTSLWVGSLGDGISAVTLTPPERGLSVKSVKRYRLGGQQSSNYFFKVFRDSAGAMWFANRGSGLYELSEDYLHQIYLESGAVSEAVKDVFSIAQSGETLWLGTGGGLVGISRGGDGEVHFGKGEGLPNTTIHEVVVEEGSGAVWMSSNDGILRFDPAKGSFEHFGEYSGLTLLEYSDGAAYQRDGELYFGGIDGWVKVTENRSYVPEPAKAAEISFNRLEKGDGVENLYEILYGGGGGRLVLAPKDNNVKLSFGISDNRSFMSYDFFYRLEKGRKREWVRIQSPDIMLTDIASGRYVLTVRAVNRESGAESLSEPVRIVKRPYWYASRSFMVSLLLIFAAFCALAVRTWVAGMQRRHGETLKEMERKHRDELYEEKLRFFTNVTHEFRTPLTLMYVPCEQILAYKGSDSEIRKYASQIKRNVELLNRLIQEIIDYRRLETRHQKLSVSGADVSGLCLRIADNFSSLAADRRVTFDLNIAEGVWSNIDCKWFARVASNLIINAFKYTEAGGTVRFSLSREDGSVVLKIYNTGKGIKPEDRARIFDRYDILSSGSSNPEGLTSGSNGLGLAICRNAVDLMGGTIAVESEVGRYAEFIVTLPSLPLDESSLTPEDQVLPEIPAPDLSELLADGQGIACPEDSGSGPRHPVLVVDDNEDICRLLKSALALYDVVTAASAEEAFDIIRRDSPALVITDVMMPGMDGYEFTRKLKDNKHTTHIPVVILSAKSSSEDRVTGAEQGADAYIGKPFSMNELAAVVAQLLKKTDRMKEYYDSSASAFDFRDGRLLSAEDREFLDRLAQYMDSGGATVEGGVDGMAEALHLSVRNLYRRFKELGLPTPNVYMTDMKLEKSARMLKTTEKTVDEIIYECGFSNRTSFYREFRKKYELSPKEYRFKHTETDETL